MTEFLAPLKSLPGVLGVLFFNETDECIAHLLQPPYDPVLFTQVFTELRGAWEVLSYLGPNPWSGVLLRFDAGHLYVRRILTGHLMVLADSSTNLTMVSVGCNVLGLKLEKSGSSGSFPSFVSNQAVGVASPVSATPSPSPSQKPAMTDSQSHPKLPSPAQTPSQPPAPAAEPPADAVGRPLVEELMRVLAKRIGPFAKVYLREALGSLGVNAATLGRSQYEALLALLAKNIPDANQSRDFVTEARGLLTKR